MGNSFTSEMLVNSQHDYNNQNGKKPKTSRIDESILIEYWKEILFIIPFAIQIN